MRSMRYRRRHGEAKWRHGDANWHHSDWGRCASAMDLEGDGRTRERPRRAAVMSDVGRLAGVSHQTGSRVINGSRQGGLETRERVVDAVAQLVYRRTPIARALVAGRSNMLGVLSFDTTLYGPASTLFGIERAAHEAGYFIIVASLKALNRSSVSATRHLLSLGHETVWHITGPADFLESQQRLHGWRETLQTAGAPVPAHLVGDWSPRSGYDLGCVLSRDPAVTALFVANDQMALGVLRAMHKAGRDIPRDISVIGFDDVPEAQYFTPPLTTVRQDFGELGARGLRLLLAIIEARATGASPPSGSRITPELIVRSSTAVVP